MPKTKIKTGKIGSFVIKSTKISEKPSLKEKWDGYSTIASFFYKISATIGAIVVFSYLFEIGFFPTGLTAAEVIFFIFVAMGFGLVYLVMLGFGAVSAIWFVQLQVWIRNRVALKPRQGKKRWFGGWLAKALAIRSVHRARFRIACAVKRGDHPLHPELRGPMYLGLSLLLFAFLVLIAVLANANPVRRLAVSIFLIGFFALLLSNGKVKKTVNTTKNSYWNSVWVRMMLAVIAPLFLLITLHSAMDLVHVVFQQLGIRMLNVSVEMPVSELDSINRASDVLARPLLDCRRSEKGDRVLVHHANILWTGVGNVTYLSFVTDNPAHPRWFEPDPKPLKQVTLRVDTSSVHIIDAQPPLNSCFDLPSDMLFGTAKFDLTEEAKAKLKTIVESIKTGGPVERIVVRGHSDSRRIGGQMGHEVGDNQKLSERRAEVVASELKSLLDSPLTKMTSEGAGSREPKVNCPVGAATTPYEAQQCNAPNRRVEIRVTYASGS